VIGILRFLGLFNAAIWLGSAVVAMLLPSAFFSAEMKTLLQHVYDPYSGAIAGMAFKRLFAVQTVCAVLAILHVFATWLYLGRPLQKLNFWLVLSLAILTFIGAVGLQGKIRNLHLEKYSRYSTVEQKELAAKSLKRWHITSELLALVTLGGLVVYFWRLSNPVDVPRFVSASKFRG
jgi:hypothetical protein